LLLFSIEIIMVSRIILFGMVASLLLGASTVNGAVCNEEWVFDALSSGVVIVHTKSCNNGYTQSQAYARNSDGTGTVNNSPANGCTYGNFNWSGWFPNNGVPQMSFVSQCGSSTCSEHINYGNSDMSWEKECTGGFVAFDIQGNQVEQLPPIGCSYSSVNWTNYGNQLVSVTYTSSC